MNTTRCIAPAVVLAMVMLSGCTPAQSLDTPAERSEAVEEEFALIADAVSAFDAEAIEQLRCEEPRLIEVPRTEDLGPDAALPLSVEVYETEPLDLSGSSFRDPDPSAQFHLASLREREIAAGRDSVLLPDVIVRVDDREACLWAMGPAFVILLGL